MTTSPSILTREAGTSIPAARRRRRRPSASHILITLAVVFAFGLNYLALQRRDATVTVAQARDGLAAGAVFHAASVDLVPVPLDLPGLDQLLPADEMAQLEGWVVISSISPGSLLDRASFRPPASADGRRLMSIPIPIEHAAGASISVGDQIDVISVSDGSARFVASNLTVTSVADSAKGAFSAGSGYFVVVAVDAMQALDLAQAIDEGSVEIILSTGAAPVEENR